MAGARKAFLLRVHFLDGRTAERRYRAEAGAVLTPDNIDKLLDAESAELETTFPGREFRLVELTGGNFNIVEEKAEALSA